MILETSRVSRFKAIILGILLLSSFVALSLSHVPVSFAQQNNTDSEVQQNSNANLTETLARQLGQVFESSSASSLENATLPTIGVLSSTNGSQPSNVFPEVDANAPPIVNQGEIVSLNGTGTYDPDSNQLQYAWSQDSGIPVSINDDDQPVAHFTAPTVSQNSILVFNLLVEDANGAIGKNTTSVTVQATSKPHANAGADQTVDEGEWVTLDGEDSYDPNGDELDYSWTQTSGQGVDLQDADEVQTQFRAPSVNDDTSLKFELRVEDQNGRADEDSATVNVNGINSNSDDLPCVQTYDTAHGTYVTDCNGNGGGNNGNTGNGSLPILTPCQPGSINPNCKPVTTPCEPGSINPNCKPVTQPLKPNTQPKKIENNPVKENTQPKKIVTQPVKKPAKYEPPKNVPTKEHKSQKPQSNPPKPPAQKFKSSGGSGGSKLRR
jgi:hypothetical protein